MKKNSIFCAVFAAALNLFAANADVKQADENPVVPIADSVVKRAETASVVKIFTVSSQPDYYQPWQNQGQQQSSGSGFVISGNRILTNAHNIANQTFIMVRKQSDPKRYIAKLEFAGHDCDLAILKVDDQDFFKDLPAMELGEMPQLQDKVSVLGYPIGGDNISVTEGVISRIEPITYSHSGVSLLAVQIDAAINPGNSGGPVVDSGKVVGVAFQGLSKAQNIGFIIPMPVVRHFLKDIQDGVFQGFPDCPFDPMKMENPDLRRWIGMTPDQSGIMIKDLPPELKKKDIFKINDVVLAIDGVKVANDATVPFRKNEVIFFANLIWEKYIGDSCRFIILRDKKQIEVNFKLERMDRLVPPRTFDKLPVYYIIGGLVFVPLSTNYLDCWGGYWTKAPRELVNFLFDGEITAKRNEIVVLSMVLADSVNMGYQEITAVAVFKANGVKIKNLKHLIDIIENMDSGFLELELQTKDKVVLDISASRKATTEILERYRIPADRSANFKAESSIFNLPLIPKIF
jgi:S1-C subfamily serine protease